MAGASRALEELLSQIAAGGLPDAGGFVCSPDGAAWRLRIWGRLAPTWAGNVSLHCCAARIPIVEGEALRLGDLMCAGTFLLGVTPGAANPGGFDFLQMARRRPAVIPSLMAPEIVDVAVEQHPEHGSGVVRIVGRDQLGFLACILGRISSCDLEPQRISLRTTADGLADDRFVLLGIDGKPPTADALSRLEDLLLEV